MSAWWEALSEGDSESAPEEMVVFVEFVSVESRFSLVFPLAVCCFIVAFTAELPGFLLEYAQIKEVWLVMRGFEGTVNVMEVEEELEYDREDFRVALRDGDETTVGMTLLLASLWERVMVPSELGQVMTIGVLAMVDPNPTAIHPKSPLAILFP